MIEIGNIEFYNPWFLLLLLVPLGMGAWYFARQGSYYTKMRLPQLEAFGQSQTWRAALRPFLFYLRLIALSLLILAFARPQTVTEEQKINTEGIDIVLAMDVSSSMLAKDFDPDRLEAAKKVAATFIDQRQQDRIGLVVFAGEAFTQCPPTTDHSALKRFLSGLTCGVLEDGTAMGMGLATAVNRLDDSEAKSRIVILLTDGVNNAGYIQPMTATALAKKLNIKVYTIGVGTRGEARAPIARRSDGQYVFGYSEVRIDEELLEEIANQTKGRYFRATDMESLESVYREIDQLEKVKMEKTIIRNYKEEFRLFLGLGAMLLLLELLLGYTIFRTAV